MNKEKIKKLAKKGFTLIELIVVIAVLGILVLLAAPKFLGYTQDAKMAQIKADIKSYETVLSSKLIHNDDFVQGWEHISKEDMEKFRDENALMTKKSKVASDYIFDETYVEVPKNMGGIKTSLKGDFIMDTDGDVYYYENGLKIADSKPGTPITGGGGEVLAPDSGTGTQPIITSPAVDPPVIEKEPEPEPEPVEEVHEATLADFQWFNADGWTEQNNSYNAVGQTGLGYYKYTGPTDKSVVIPSKIGDTPVTSYYRMFELSNVTKVISDNTNVKNANGMFMASKASKIDVSELNTSSMEIMDYMFASATATEIVLGDNFNTSNATSMYAMFSGVNVPSLDLSKFDTRKVTNMNAMFSSSPSVTSIEFGPNFKTSSATNMGAMFQLTQIENLDLSFFDTSNVTDMASMFNNVKSKTIDLSSFNTSKVTDMDSMFNNAINLSTLDLSTFDLVKVTSTSDILGRLKSGTTVYAKSSTEVSKLRTAGNTPSDVIIKTK